MKLFITHCLLFLLVSSTCSQAQNFWIKGTISNYSEKPIYIYQCYGDTLLLIDSVKTDAQGNFIFSITDHRSVVEPVETPITHGLYRFNLPHNQWFYILNDGKATQIKTVYQFSAFYNIATDSLQVIKSDENKKFYEFQHLQQKLNIANYWLLQMMRLYPLPDPFHKQIEDEYFSRYKAMDNFVKKILNPKPVVSGAEPSQILNKSLSTKVALAYYQPINPDWKQPDPWRDSIIAVHYFDYFNPADSFYLHTNILPEKMDMYLALCTNKKDAYGQPIYDEMLYAKAAETFLQTVIAGQNSITTYNLRHTTYNLRLTTYDLRLTTYDLRLTTYDFCLNYLLKKFNKEHKEAAFLYLCDQYLNPKEGDCKTEKDQFDWAREKAGKLRNIAIGSIAPNFKIDDKLQLNDIQSDYTLLLFWATWCSHCTQAVPEIKKAADEFNSKLTTNDLRLITVAISLDTDNAQWQKFVTDNNLLSFLNFSELKGWKGEVPKQYNVYATPTMFLLDKDKKIIAKPINTDELKQHLDKIRELSPFQKF